MRITFLTSGLEPGKDGVGDYTRLLAQECGRMGHACSVIALNDVFAGAPPAEEILLPSRRFGSSQPWRYRCGQAREFITQFDPDLVSLQFVPYGYHSKGLPLLLARRLRTMIGGKRLHVMFHELWIGAYRGAPLKERLIGWLQRTCINRMLQHLRPSFIHTSNSAYQKLLLEHGVNARLLPVFGNIPISESLGEDWAFAEYQRSARTVSREGTWVFAIFGTLHPVWTAEPLFTILRAAAAQAGKQIVIASIGRLGPGEALWNRLSSHYQQPFGFIQLGEQSADRISRFLQSADFGISASPWTLIEKSGSVASMLDHGLPVIVNRDDIHFGSHASSPLSSTLLLRMDANLEQKLVTTFHLPPRPSLPEVARTFLASFG